MRNKFLVDDKHTSVFKNKIKRKHSLRTLTGNWLDKLHILRIDWVEFTRSRNQQNIRNYVIVSNRLISIFACQACEAFWEGPNEPN